MRTPACIAILLVAVVVLGAGCVGESQPPPEEAEKSVLLEAVAGINGELNRSTPRSARAPGPRQDRAYECRRQGGGAAGDAEPPYTESTLVATKEGIVTMAVPESYAGTVGSDISSHAETERSVQEQVPLVSEVFPLAEGYAGVAQSYPIFGAGGEYIGFVSVAYRSDALISRAIVPLINGTPYDIWVAQTDGLVVYDTTPEEIGRNLFTDPVYQAPGLQEAFSRIVAEPSGSLEYSFWDRNWDRNVTKKAIWDTAGICGTEWRVVATQSADAGEVPATTGERPPVADTAGDMKAFVGEAAAYAREHGRTDALAAFNNPAGEFVRDELYIFAYDMNGTVLALPFQQALIGAN